MVAAKIYYSHMGNYKYNSRGVIMGLLPKGRSLSIIMKITTDEV